jgi:hypothetical protein
MTTQLPEVVKIICFTKKQPKDQNKSEEPPKPNLQSCTRKEEHVRQAKKSKPKLNPEISSEIKTDKRSFFYCKGII